MNHGDGAYTTLSVWLPKWVGSLIASQAEQCGCDTQDLLGFQILSYLQVGAAIAKAPNLHKMLGAEQHEYRKIMEEDPVDIAIRD